MYEKCFMRRIEKWNAEYKVIDDLQGATQLNCSSLNTAWLTKETICYNLENGKTVYVGLLDIKKAYDTVWQEGLFFKLYKLGMNGKSWRILRHFYKEFMCQIKLCGGVSAEFEALQGIHQGVPSSLFMFATFHNELIKRIRKLCVGAKLCKEITSCPTFADDMTVIALAKEGLQMMFNEAYAYSLVWRFEFSPTKCKIIIFGKDTNYCKDGK